MSEKISVYQAVAKVMEDVIAIRKGDTNEHFKFKFRGIDAVMNAVGPALRTHGVVIVPIDMQAEHYPVEGKSSVNVRVRNTYRWYGPAGDYFDSVATGESIDTGDKGTAKANSVAFRTLLLQSLCLPTDEPDPDSFSPQRGEEIRTESAERIAAKVKATESVEELRELWQAANRVGAKDLCTEIQAKVKAVQGG